MRFVVIRKADPDTEAGRGRHAIFERPQIILVHFVRLVIAALVLLDPFLVHSLGFGLSCGASAGILLLAGPLAAGVYPVVVTLPLMSVTVSVRPLRATSSICPSLMPTCRIRWRAPSTNGARSVPRMR